MVPALKIVSNSTVGTFVIEEEDFLNNWQEPKINNEKKKTRTFIFDENTDLSIVIFLKIKGG